METNIIILLASIVTSIPWAFLLYTLYHSPEKIEKWASIGYRALSWLSKKYEKRGISGDITSDIKSFKRKFNGSTGKFLPYDININWQEDDTKESFIRKNKVVVRMKYQNNQSRNVMHATLLYIEAGLLPNIKNHTNNLVRRASELVLTEKILIEEERHSARQLLENEVILTETTQNQHLSKNIETLKRLDNEGAFTRIFLKEMSYFGDKVSNLIPNNDIRKETVEFINKLDDYTKRRRGDLDSPGYFGNYIKTSIVLIARQETYLTFGITPYIRYINKALGEGVVTFYLCAKSDPNIIIVKDILEGLENHPNLKMDGIESYKLSNNLRAICATLKRR